MAVPEQLWEGSEGSVLMFELGSCNVCVCVTALGLWLFLQPPRSSLGLSQPCCIVISCL